MALELPEPRDKPATRNELDAVDLGRVRNIVLSRAPEYDDGSHDPTEAGAYRLLGHGVTVTNRVPDTTAATPTGQAALVDMSQVAVARDQAPSVKVLDQTFGDYAQMALRVTARYDVAPLNPEAVVKLTGITIAA